MLKEFTRHALFICSHGHLAAKRKILYLLTPPPGLSNIGDHAQAVAIRNWMARHYPGLSVLELDKNESDVLIPALRFILRREDLIFLHSGGNLGDRGLWSERIRRKIICAFPQNKIVSLPQTIYFSESPVGIEEREKTKTSYATHPNLVILTRDSESYAIALRLFPKARIHNIPDFVLSMAGGGRAPRQKNNPPRLLFCLRRDRESILSAEDRRLLGEAFPYERLFFDTTLPHRIPLSRRAEELEKTLELFGRHDVVITDRYHGLIFSVLCRKPCVVIRTVDHKLTSAMDWFRRVPFVFYAERLEELSRLVERGLATESFDVPDWNAEYFDGLKEIIQEPRP